MPPARAVFYFDLASPLAYLAAERMHALPRPAEWQPVLARELPASETFEAFRCAREEEVFRAEVERSAAALGLQPLRWPEDFPFDSERAMLAATYSKSIGRAVPFAQAAFRQAFAGGRSLAREDNVLIAAAACEMHPRAVLAGAARARTHERLRSATAAAARAGVRSVPAVRVGAKTFHGERAVEEAAAHLRAVDAASTSAGVEVPEMPAADVLAAGMPAADVLAADAPAEDVPAADVPAGPAR
jgi:2-hydroxychromene-2-carboxylate isomerase